jgi:hypothetical protein
VRSTTAAGQDGQHHVVPSMIFQPVVDPTPENLRTEWSVTHNVFREYLEELFGVPEVMPGDDAAAGYFDDHPNLRLLRALLASGAARHTGVALTVNLLNHRPEICTLLVVEDEAWFGVQRDEAAARRRGLRHLTLDGDLRTLPLADERWARLATPWSFVPPGAAALALGARDACRSLGLPEPAWLRALGVDPPSARL